MNGVVAYIAETEEGRTTLTFDDVSSETPTSGAIKFCTRGPHTTRRHWKKWLLQKNNMLRLVKISWIRLLAINGKLR